MAIRSGMARISQLSTPANRRVATFAGNFAPTIATTLHLDQNYPSGIAKRKPAP